MHSNITNNGIMFHMYALRTRRVLGLTESKLWNAHLIKYHPAQQWKIIIIHATHRCHIKSTQTRTNTRTFWWLRANHNVVCVDRSMVRFMAQLVSTLSTIVNWQFLFAHFISHRRLECIGSFSSNKWQHRKGVPHCYHLNMIYDTVRRLSWAQSSTPWWYGIEHCSQRKIVTKVYHVVFEFMTFILHCIGLINLTPFIIQLSY